MDRKLVVIYRKTRLEELVEKYNSVDQARFYIESLGEDFLDYLVENDNYQKSMERMKKIISGLNVRFHFVEKRFLTNYIFNPDDLIIVHGQDGLVANTLKYLEGQAVIGVNPDPERWEGKLLPFLVNDLRLIIADSLKNNRPFSEVTMAQAVLNDGQVLKAVNDFFIGVKNHSSFRYVIETGQEVEHQSSSGIIISAPLGGTAWLTSVLTGAQKIMSHFGQVPKINKNLFKSWEERKLIYSVREPFPSLYSEAENCFGILRGSEKLTIRSETPENAVIFSDGIQEDFIEFSSGTVAQISVSETRGILVA